jgi:hypothetical protein
MDVLKILKERKRVLKHAYKLTGASNQYYRIEELEHLIRIFTEELNKNRCKLAAGLAESG